MAKSKSKSKAPAIWVLVGGGVIIGAYYLLRPTPGPGKTEAAPLPPLKLPSAYASFGAVRTAFEDVKTNWRMGRYEAGDTLNAVAELLDAGETLRAEGMGEVEAWSQLVAEMNRLVEDVEDYVALQSVSA